MTALNKTSNHYADIIPPALYAATPKAVFAAMAVSYAINSSDGDQRGAAETFLREEWAALYAAGIVPQRPPK